MKITIEPTKQQIAFWIDAFVPKQDLFFIEETDLAYMYWNIEGRMTHVIVAQPEWIEQMALQKKQQLLTIQAGSGRGLVFPVAMIPEAPEDFSIELDGAPLVVM